MSHKAVSWVLRYSPYTGNAKVIHLVLADLANEAHGWEVWASHQSVAERAKVSRRTVIRVHQIMVEDGFLTVLDTPAGSHNRYGFLMPDPVPPRDTLSQGGCDTLSQGGVTDCHGGVCQTVTGGVTLCHRGV